MDAAVDDASGDAAVLAEGGSLGDGGILPLFAPLPPQVGVAANPAFDGGMSDGGVSDGGMSEGGKK